MAAGGWGLTPTILAILRRTTQDGIYKMAVKLHTTTPYYWCTGYESVTIDDSPYTPKAMNVPDLSLSGEDSRMTMIFGDVVDDDATPYTSLADHNYTERFSGLRLDWWLGLYENGVWTQVYYLVWYVERCHWRDGEFRMELTGSVGTYPRAGLPPFTRRCNLLFKGTLCGYAGGLTTCSGSLEDCQVRLGTPSGDPWAAGNILNFRGANIAPEPGDVMKLGNQAFAFGQGSNTQKPVPTWDPIFWHPLQIFHRGIDDMNRVDSQAGADYGVSDDPGIPPGPPQMGPGSSTL